MPPIQEILIQKNVPAAMRDGTILMSNVYRPASGGPYPVLLTRQPYGKDLPIATTYLDSIKAAEAGYIVVIQDVRGRYASEGEFTPFVSEFDDGYDTVEWAAKLPGSDGRVGMWGESYFGETQWQAAVMGPSSLRSMVPGITWGNHLNGVQMRGGAQELGLMFYWASSAIAPSAVFRKYRGEPEQLQKKLPAVVGLMDTISAGGGYDVLPLADLPDPEGLVPFMHGGFDRPVDDPSWDHVNIDGRYDRVNAPTFHIGGWYDCFIGETLRQYEAMKARSEETGMRPPRLLVGPWTHGEFGSSTIGDLDFGLASTGLFINYRGDLTDAHLRWFDATLKGDEAPLEGVPPVEVFVMGENRWRGYDAWPPPDASEEEWFFGGGGNANTSSGDGTLSRRGPGGEADRYDYDPENPVPTLGGAVLMAPIYGRGARDQRPNEERPDVLCYTSEVLEEGYTVLGPVYVNLFAASSAPDTDFVARLVDVYPDGRSIVVADGIVRVSARESYPAPAVVSPTKPTPIKPGEVYEYVVDLWASGITFLSGHRIRVEITSSSFPRWERNLNTGEGGAHSARSEVARQTVFHDPERPSRVTLTVV
jgi:putative CocE/NonD family hydrolase